jgi:hypothetical protein
MIIMIQWNASDYVSAGMFVLCFLCSTAVAVSALQMQQTPTA